MYKRIISFLLVFVFLFITSASAFAATNNEIDLGRPYAIIGTSSDVAERRSVTADNSRLFRFEFTDMTGMLVTDSSFTYSSLSYGYLWIVGGASYSDPTNRNLTYQVGGCKISPTSGSYVTSEGQYVQRNNGDSVVTYLNRSAFNTGETYYGFVANQAGALYTLTGWFSFYNSTGA